MIVILHNPCRHTNQDDVKIVGQFEITTLTVEFKLKFSLHQEFKLHYIFASNYNRGNINRG